MPPPRHAAAEISVRYAHGDDVAVPLAAENADSVRRFRTAQWLRDIEESHPAWGP